MEHSRAAVHVRCKRELGAAPSEAPPRLGFAGHRQGVADQRGSYRSEEWIAADLLVNDRQGKNSSVRRCGYQCVVVTIFVRYDRPAHACARHEILAEGKPKERHDNSPLISFG